MATVDTMQPALATLAEGSARPRAPNLRPVKLRWPQHAPDEIEAVVDVLRTGRVNALVHGEQCRRFEEEFAAFCGTPFAIAVGNGTLALELALRALNVGPGDEVILPARSFFASAASIVAVGATPVFADIDPVSHTIDPASAERLINPRTRAILCVHLAGWPCAMDELVALSGRHAIALIEDCAQAHGARYKGRRVGGFGDAAAFSFCTDKIISTGGEGGMLLLRDRGHWARAWAYKDHGKNPDKIFNPPPESGFRYVHDSFGSNFRMTEMQAAIGRVQLGKLPVWLDRRRANARALTRLLDGQPGITIPEVPAHVEHAYYKFYLLLEPEYGSGDGARARIVAALNALGIPASNGTCPDMSREAAFDGHQPAGVEALGVADAIGRRTLMLPVDHLLDEDDMQQMAAVIRSVLADGAPSENPS